MALLAADEGPHAPGADPWWQETWVFELWTDAGDLGAFTWLTLVPGLGRAWYWAELVRPGLPSLHLLELDLARPRTGLEVRGDGVWADHVCEAPFEQWTVANEAYALALDQPGCVVNEARGQPQPFAFDLEWYADGAPEVQDGGYRQPGSVDALIELASGQLRFEARSQRHHRWGRPAASDAAEARSPGASPVRLPDGTVVHRAFVPGEGWHEWRTRPSA